MWWRWCGEGAKILLKRLNCFYSQVKHQRPTKLQPLLEWVSLKSLICPFHHANGRSHHPIIAPQLSEVKQMQFVWGHTVFKSGLTTPPCTSQQIIILSITTLYKQPPEPHCINHLFTHWHSRISTVFFWLLLSNTPPSVLYYSITSQKSSPYQAIYCFHYWMFSVHTKTMHPI